jgi:hypothetical protein
VPRETDAQVAPKAVERIHRSCRSDGSKFEPSQLRKLGVHELADESGTDVSSTGMHVSTRSQSNSLDAGVATV